MRLLSKNLHIFNLKIVEKLSEIWYGLGIRAPEKTYPGFGSRGQNSTGPRIRNTVKVVWYRFVSRTH
jgi:hypothetical protein